MNNYLDIRVVETSVKKFVKSSIKVMKYCINIDKLETLSSKINAHLRMLCVINQKKKYNENTRIPCSYVKSN